MSQSHNFTSHMKLPGSVIYESENLDDAAYRVLFELTGIKNIYLQQFRSFGSPDRTKHSRDVIWLENAIHMTEEPLYPFGFGLSYTSFQYSDIAIDKTKIKKGETVTVTAKVTNTGKWDGEEVVQLYVTDVKASTRVPLYSLDGVKRLKLKSGESQTVSFQVTPHMGLLSAIFMWKLVPETKGRTLESIEELWKKKK